MMISKLTALLEILGRRPDLVMALLTTVAAATLLLVTLAALRSAARSPHHPSSSKARWALAIVGLPLLGAALWFRAGKPSGTPEEADAERRRPRRMALR
jgi:hypothetical protein